MGLPLMQSQSATGIRVSGDDTLLFEPADIIPVVPVFEKYLFGMLTELGCRHAVGCRGPAQLGRVSDDLDRPVGGVVIGNEEITGAGLGVVYGFPEVLIRGIRYIG